MSVWASPVRLSPTLWICSRLVPNTHHPPCQESRSTCPLLRPHNTWQNPAHNRQVEWQEHLAFHARVPSLAVRGWIFRWRAFPCRRVTASLQKAGSLPATFLTGLVRLSTPSLPAAETSAPRGLPHRKVTEKVTLISEPATESPLTPAPD